MKFIFFGTPEFAATILDRLITAGFMPSAVVCNPDRPVGRKKIITKPPVKSLIMEHETLLHQGSGGQAWNIEILQPEDLTDLKAKSSQLKAFNPDFFVVAAYAKIIPKEILDIPRLGTIGVHPSLLPKYRGASPIQSVILNGETGTGVTLYMMDEKMDNGPILGVRTLDLGLRETYGMLLKKLAELGGKLLIETLPKFLAGGIVPEPQDRSQATFTKKFITEDGFINEKELNDAENGKDQENVKIIDRKIRALTPEPGVWTLRNGKRLKILEAHVGSGKLALTKIQVEGEKPKNQK